MPVRDVDLEEIYEHARTSLARSAGGDASLIDALQQFTHVSSCLDELPSTGFSKAWLLETVAIELLKYMIEDDCVDISAVAPAARAAASALLESDDWIHPKLTALIENFQQVARASALPTQRLLVQAPAFGTSCQFVARLASGGRPLIPVSSQYSAFVPILEDTLSDPVYARGLVDGFIGRIASLRDEHDLTAICFVEKAVGPVGALSMLSGLVTDLGLPASVYRANHWPTRARVTGYQPTPDDRMILVYDLLVTGDGLRQAAYDLRKRTAATVEAAIVLFGYGRKRTNLDIEVNTTMRVEALAWEEDLEAQIAEIASGATTRTENIAVLPSGRRSISLSPAEGRANRISSARGERNMHDLSHGRERDDKFIAIQFSDEWGFTRGLELLETRSDIPFSLPGSRNIALPERALEWFEADLERAGVKFKRIPVVTAGDLSNDEINRIRAQAAPSPDPRYRDVAWKRARISELKRKLSA